MTIFTQGRYPNFRCDETSCFPIKRLSFGIIAHTIVNTFLKSPACTPVLRHFGVQSADVPARIDPASLHAEEPLLVAIGEPRRATGGLYVVLREHSRALKISAVVPVQAAAELIPRADEALITEAGACLRRKRMPRVTIVRIAAAEVHRDGEPRQLDGSARAKTERTGAVLIPCIGGVEISALAISDIRRNAHAHVPAVRLVPAEHEPDAYAPHPRGVRVVQRIPAVRVRVRILTGVGTDRACPGYPVISHKVRPPGRAVLHYGGGAAECNGASVPESPPVRVTIPHAPRERPARSRDLVQRNLDNLKMNFRTGKQKRPYFFRTQRI